MNKALFKFTFTFIVPFVVFFRQHRPNCPVCNDLIWPRAVPRFYWDVNDVGARNQVNIQAQSQTPLPIAQVTVAPIPMQQNPPVQRPIVHVPIAQNNAAIQQPRVVLVRAHIPSVAQVQAIRAQPIQHRRQSANGNNSSVVPQPIRNRRQTTIGNGSVPANGIQRIRRPRQQMLNYDRVVCGVCGKIFVSSDREYICSKRCRDRLLWIDWFDFKEKQYFKYVPLP